METRDGENAAVTGATCLFAIYDPVSGHCAITRAGHRGPALVHPDGSVAFPDVPFSPPLGLGAGLPVETPELQVPDGSRLALYTDGLVEDCDRDSAVGLELLRDALAHPGQTPEQACQAVLDALLPTASRRHRPHWWPAPNGSPRTGSPTGTYPPTPRGLDEIAFTAELILGELVTNAIRCGGDPIRVPASAPRGHHRRGRHRARSSGANSPWTPPRPSPTKP
ncbi:PP2C family protein-serine/threonine phosphatase [Streptomyces sp. AC555_RSS877]|uniref:PP2C family protein-serine/threonine phosphatase n=1 Tax=Streptomyces sp. AC555_RSS877 TaxID=2823688 RepID=UPI001C264F67